MSDQLFLSVAVSAMLLLPIGGCAAEASAGSPLDSGEEVQYMVGLDFERPPSTFYHIVRDDQEDEFRAAVRTGVPVRRDERPVEAVDSRLAITIDDEYYFLDVYTNGRSILKGVGAIAIELSQQQVAVLKRAIGISD